MIKKIEYWWRHNIVYPVFRRIFHNKEVRLPIDIHAIKSILILRYDRIGDMIVTTPIFKGLKNENPNLKIGVLASETNADIVKNNPNIDETYVLYKSKWKSLKEIWRARKDHYDVVLNLVFNRTTSGGILSNLIVNSGVKIGQGASKYKFYFNGLISIERDNCKMIEILSAYLLKTLGLNISEYNSDYEIFISDKVKNRINLFLDHHQLESTHSSTQGHSQYIVFNLSASDSLTRLSEKQAEEIGLFLSKKNKTIFIYAPKDHTMKNIAEKICCNTTCLIYPEKGEASLDEIAAIIEGAKCVISPDTSIIHFASAMKTPIIGFYTSAKEKNEWLPHKVRHKIVYSNDSQPASSIPASKMIEEIEDFLKTL